MNIAFEEARKGTGRTWKNPLVGAVIVKNDRILSVGYHHQFGQEHAEINALGGLADVALAQGATMYVTLEPCSHFGKTPPCANRLVEVGIRRVVIGQMDPNPIVAGKGIAILKNAGVEVKVLNQTGKINDKYNFFYQNGRPFLTIKYAMTLDGKINQNQGKRSVVSDKESYHDAQKLRGQNQAILIGENTLSVDNPMLTVRDQKPIFEPLKVLLVNSADKLNAKSVIFNTQSDILILSRTVTNKKWPKNVEVVVDSEWSPKLIVKLLTKRGIQSLLIEGGSHVHAIFMASQLVDEIDVYVAPIIFGGGGLPAVWDNNALQIPDYQLSSKVNLGQDIKFTLRRK